MEFGGLTGSSDGVGALFPTSPIMKNAAANAAGPRAALSLGGAAYELLSLNAATSLITSKDALSGPYENIGLVSALLLTMVSLSSADVGTAFPGVEKETASKVYIVTAFISMGGFFASTLTSAFIVIFGTGMNNDEEALAWVSECRLIFKLTIFVFFSSLLVYLFHVSWLLVTLLGVDVVSFACLTLGWCLMALIIYALMDSMRVIYTIYSMRAPSSVGA